MLLVVHTFLLLDSQTHQALWKFKIHSNSKPTFYTCTSGSTLTYLDITFTSKSFKDHHESMLGYSGERCWGSWCVRTGAK